MALSWVGIRALCSNKAVAPLPEVGAPTSLDTVVEEGLQTRLDEMESAALAEVPREERMQALGDQISNELLQAGLQYQDTIVGDGPAAGIGTWPVSLAFRFVLIRCRHPQASG